MGRDGGMGYGSYVLDGRMGLGMGLGFWVLLEGTIE